MAIDLALLPIDHPLRISPLAEIGSEYLPKGGKMWRKVLPSFGIAKATYNSLGDVWLNGTEWRATICHDFE